MSSCEADSCSSSNRWQRWTPDIAVFDATFCWLGIRQRLVLGSLLFDSCSLLQICSFSRGSKRTGISSGLILGADLSIETCSTSGITTSSASHCCSHTLCFAAIYTCWHSMVHVVLLNCTRNIRFAMAFMAIVAESGSPASISGVFGQFF